MRIPKFTSHLARVARRAMNRIHVERAHSRDVPTAIAVEVHANVPPSSSPARKQRVDAWRRRVLLRKGARLHAASVDRGDRCSLAMLDTHGIVVGWYDNSRDCSRVGTHVIDRHVSQFYLPADLAADLPNLNLASAAVCGGSTQLGWRRQPSGAIIWGTTVIEAIMMNDGRLQGFTHVIRPAEGPRADVRQTRRPLFRASVASKLQMQRSGSHSGHVGATA